MPNGAKISAFGPYLRLSSASPSIFNADSQAGGRDFGEPSLVLAPFLSAPLSPRMTLLFHAGGTPTLPSIAALKGARASCPPEPGRLRHLILWERRRPRRQERWQGPSRPTRTSAFPGTLKPTYRHSLFPLFPPSSFSFAHQIVIMPLKKQNKRDTI